MRLKTSCDPICSGFFQLQPEASQRDTNSDMQARAKFWCDVEYGGHLSDLRIHV